MWSRPTVFTALAMDVNATYLACDGTRVPVLVSLGFDPLDPVAVTIRARSGDPGPATLALARDLFTRATAPASASAPVPAPAPVPVPNPPPTDPAGGGAPQALAAPPDGIGPCVEPVLRGGLRLIAISLPGPYGRSALEMSATRVVDFVRRTYEVVPAEAEAALIDLDLDLGLAALGCA
ncbi:SsgA family sporulation/cell division regulator [Parafrankia sp. FMc2]|uniref:SsgA family sporulation/cell division regulator n=1 Tax=Parafrankia sp. FMc2 TaxID=3233196 RepID=UPI0034D60473